MGRAYTPPPTRITSISIPNQNGRQTIRPTANTNETQHPHGNVRPRRDTPIPTYDISIWQRIRRRFFGTK